MQIPKSSFDSKPEFTAGELARLVEGELVGDAERMISSVASIDQAGPHAATFAQDRRTLSLYKDRPFGVVLGPVDAPALSSSLIRVPHPRLAWNKVLALFAPKVALAPGVDPSAHVSPQAQLAADVRVGPFAVICPGAKVGAGTVLYPGVYLGHRSVIGENCLIYPNVVIREEVEIGDRVIIGPGTIVGGDGFGFVAVDGKHHKVPQIGKVVIEADVELGSLVAVDRAMMGETRIRRGTKVDNLVQIAHNVDIGEDCLLISLAGIAGSTNLGPGVIMAGQSGAAGHQTIGAGSVIMARGLVAGDLPPGSQVSGVPARPHKEELHSRAAQLRLPKELKRIRELESKVAQLEAILGEVK